MRCFCSLAAESHRLLLQTYEKYAPLVKTSEYWFRPFKSGDFDLNQKERPYKPKKFENIELQEFFDEDSAQTA